MTGGGPRQLAAILALVSLIACGKKGPPLPPLHIVPDAPTEATARRIGDEVRLRFILPGKNLNGPLPVNLDRVEVYAATVAAGAAAPPNRELLTAKYLVGTVPVKPPADEEKPAPADPYDRRPSPGEVATFVEQLDEAKLRPQFTEVVPPVPAPAAAAATPAVPAPPPVALRVYGVRGIARNGRPGQPAPRLNLPLVTAPAPPADPKVSFSETALTLSWIAPVVAPPGTAPLFNVYQGDSTAPLNPAPLEASTFERAGVEFGKEECFTLRSVSGKGPVTIESAPAGPVCVTPADTFPPAEPTGLSAVASVGGINLIWTANTEKDLAGYLVLRGEAPGDTLQPITPAPITETTFRDTTVTPGVRYVYAIQAVDAATPGNKSVPSRRVEETAR